MEKNTQTEIEAAVFRRLLKHLDDNKDVQNIDLMNLANFCRNCLSKWYVTEAEKEPVSYIHLRAHETKAKLVFFLLLDKKKNN